MEKYLGNSFNRPTHLPKYLLKSDVSVEAHYCGMHSGITLDAEYFSIKLITHHAIRIPNEVEANATGDLELRHKLLDPGCDSSVGHNFKLHLA